MQCILIIHRWSIVTIRGVGRFASRRCLVYNLGFLASPYIEKIQPLGVFLKKLFFSLRSHFGAKQGSFDSPPVEGDMSAIEIGLPNERTIRTQINGKSYVLSSDDKYLDPIRGDFEPDIVKMFNTLVGKEDTVLDVGANIGCTSILFGAQVRQVHSFEPSPTTFKYLLKNTCRAGLNNIAVHNFGLGNAIGEFTLTFSSDNRSGGFVSNQIDASEGHQVENIQIRKGDDFVKVEGISAIKFIKIDVEGFERDVIEGLSATISRYQPIVALELNHWCLNAFQRTSVPDFFDFLRGIFPYLYAVEKNDVRNLHDKNDAYHVMYHQIAGGFKYPNLVGAFHADQLRTFGATFGVRLN